MGFFRKWFKKFEVRHRKKEPKIIEKELPRKDYGDYYIDIIYSNDYIDKKIYKVIHIQPYIVFFINIDSNNKDMMDDYFNKLIPFIKTIGSKYIYKIDKNDNKLYSYIGLDGNSIKTIFKLYYPDRTDISYILSNMITAFNDQMNNGFIYADETIMFPESLRNDIDILPYTNKSIRNYGDNKGNVLGIDKIPNVNNEFTLFELLYMSHLYTNNEFIFSITDIDSYNMPNVISFLRWLLYKKDTSSIELKNTIINCIKNDSFFNFEDEKGNTVNLIDYAVHCKLIVNNIINDTFNQYNEVNEFIDDDEDTYSSMDYADEDILEDDINDVY